MGCLKGIMLGLVAGLTVGCIMGACNCDVLYDTLKQGKKEIKRFKRKYM